MPEKDKLARDIFGGSDSELSSDEDDHRSKPVQDESPDEDDDDDFIQDKPQKKSRKKTDPTRKRKRAAKPRKEDIDLSELPPEQANKIRLDLQLEAILKPKKSSRPRKRKNATDSEALDSFADDQVARLRESMITAADEDIACNNSKPKLPAVAKLRALPDAMDTLRKASLAQSIIDNNLLEAVKKWLEPLPDKSLPALNIQRQLFQTLKKMEFIDSAVLQESKLGPIVLFYTKCKRVTPDVQRMANELVSTWSRPIIKRSASFRDRRIPVASFTPIADGDHTPGEPSTLPPSSVPRPEKLTSILARAREEDKHRVRKNAVMIPQSTLGTYTVAPSANAGMTRNSMGLVRTGVDADTERRRKNAERLRTLTRKVQGS